LPPLPRGERGLERECYALDSLRFELTLTATAPSLRSALPGPWERGRACRDAGFPSPQPLSREGRGASGAAVVASLVLCAPPGPSPNPSPIGRGTQRFSFGPDRRSRFGGTLSPTPPSLRSGSQHRRLPPAADGAEPLHGERGLGVGAWANIRGLRALNNESRIPNPESRANFSSPCESPACPPPARLRARLRTGWGGRGRCGPGPRRCP